MYLGKKNNLLFLMTILCITLMILGFANLMSVNAASAWAPNVYYAIGSQVTYNGSTYNCIQAHTSIVTWEPPNVPALWTLVTGASPSPNNSATPTKTPTPTKTSTKTPASTYSPTPTNTATPTRSTYSTTPTPTSSASSTLRPGITWPQKVYAPYVDITFPTPFSINDCYNKTTQKYYSLAFITADGSGNPAWAGRIGLDQNYYMDEINNIRSKGGDVIISCGGVSGTELAQTTTDVNAVQAKYQSIINKYKLTWLDLNIESSWAVTDRTSIDVRNKAVKNLETANPGLTISYCLAVLPSGFTSDVLYIIQNAKDNGVRVDVVNLMTMNYGDYYAPNPNGQMGSYANQAAQNTYNQLVGIGLSNFKIGITPMVGLNNTPSEIFYQADAQTVLSFLQSHTWIREVAIWAGTRDNGSGGVQPAPASPYYSSINQSEFEFTNIFKAYK